MKKTDLTDERLQSICKALQEKGFDPALQISGYLLTEDPTYIPDADRARSNMAGMDRDELLYAIVRYYLENKLHFSYDV